MNEPFQDRFSRLSLLRATWKYLERYELENLKNVV